MTFLIGLGSAMEHELATCRCFLQGLKRSLTPSTSAHAGPTGEKKPCRNARLPPFRWQHGCGHPLCRLPQPCHNAAGTRARETVKIVASQTITTNDTSPAPLRLRPTPTPTPSPRGRILASDVHVGGDNPPARTTTVSSWMGTSQQFVHRQHTRRMRGQPGAPRTWPQCLSCRRLPGGRLFSGWPSRSRVCSLAPLQMV